MKLLITQLLLSLLIAGCAPKHVAQPDGRVAYVARGAFGDAMVFPIADSDGSTLKNFPNTRFASDKYRVYYEGGVVLQADPKSFRVIASDHGVDAVNVFHRSNLIPSADPKTFIALDHWVGKDLHSVFSSTHKISVCDIASFQVLKFGWKSDSQCVFSPEFKKTDLDPKSFTPISDFCGKDSNGYYNQYSRTRSDKPDRC